MDDAKIAMPHRPSEETRTLLTAVCVLACAAIAVASLAGWTFGIVELMAVRPGLPRMVPMTALLTLLTSLALGWQAGARRRALPALLACAIVLAAAPAILACHALQWAPAPLRFGGGHQASAFSLPSPVTAAMFLASAASLLCLTRPGTVKHSQWLALGVLLLALLTLAGYLFRHTFLYALLPGRGTSILTTLVFIFGAIGTLAARADEGIMVAVAGPEPGAWVARRLLVSALAAPLLLGAAVGLALRATLIDAGTAIALLVWGMVALFTVVVWRFALVLYHIDAARRAAEREREAALARLREADVHKDDFMALLAHELRNPLAPIRAAADLLRLQKSADPAQLQRTGDIIRRQADHMVHLVDDLLDLSRVRRGLIELDKVPVDARTVVQDAIEQVRPRIAARRHRLDAELPPEAPFVCGDHKRLVQAVANLLANAAKYTPEGGHIRLVLRFDARTVEVCVHDNGIGIAAELLPAVFDAFSQGTRTAGRADGGLGLGLALVRRLAELHDGSVVARSPGPGQGSTFVLTLPRLHGQDKGVSRGARPG